MDDLDVLTVAFLETHPREAARELERLRTVDAAAVLEGAPARIVAPVLTAMQPRTAAAALMMLDSAPVALVMGRLSSTAVAAVLRHVPPARRAEILDALPTVTALACRALLRYPDDAVGAFAQTQVLLFDEASTVAQALDALRGQAEDSDGAFVVTGEQRLRGWIPTVRLLRSAATLRLSALVEPITHLPALMPVTTALEDPGFATTPLAAVVERGDRLLGTVTLAALRNAHDARVREPQPIAEVTPLASLAGGYWSAVAVLAQATVSLLFASPRSPR